MEGIIGLILLLVAILGVVIGLRKEQVERNKRKYNKRKYR